MVTVHDTSMQRYVKEAEAAVASSYIFLTAGFSGLNLFQQIRATTPKHLTASQALCWKSGIDHSGLEGNEVEIM